MALATNVAEIIRASITTKRMNPFSWTLNSWYVFFQVFSLLLLTGTIFTGAGALITGYVINFRQGKEIEELKIKRLELEKALAPRQLGLLFKTPTETNFDSLKPFAGIHVIVRVLPDIEAIRASGDLVVIMQTAGWKILDVARSAELNIPFWDGVVIEPHFGGEKAYLPLSDPNKSPQEKQDLHDQLQKDETRCREAVDALVELLTSNNWVARRFAPTDEIPTNTIRVNIGFKKTPYFEPKLPNNFSMYWHGNTSSDGLPIAPPPQPTKPP